MGFSVYCEKGNSQERVRVHPICLDSKTETDWGQGQVTSHVAQVHLAVYPPPATRRVGQPGLICFVRSIAGAILADMSAIHITGKATFASNTATREGGEIDHKTCYEHMKT